MSYREHLPHRALRRHVECYWSIRTLPSAPVDRTENVLPDGCMDMIFDVGDRPFQGPAGGPATAVGSMTRPLSVRYTGRIDLWGVRFRPGAATAFLDVDASELTDASVSLEALWGGAAAAILDRVAITAPHERPGLLDRVLGARGRLGPDAVDERVLVASELLTRTRGTIPVDRIACEVGLGRRQLERRFQEQVGVTPKTAARVARFRAVVARMHAEPRVGLSALAAYGGYTDQAHMTREFRALGATTPGCYARRARRGGADGNDAFVQDGEPGPE